MKLIFMILFAVLVLLESCTGSSPKPAQKQKKNTTMFTGAAGEVKIMTLDPGHFHAALVQKNMYKQVYPTVYVFAPKGPDVQDYLKRIEGYNSRRENPASWIENVYTGPGYLERMLSEKPGNVMVTAGNNAKKTDYILKSVEAGINVLADKPMVIVPEDFPKLEEAFRVAAEKGVLLYDIMTERYEITNILQRELSMIPEVFGEQKKGTPEEPGISKESVHHFFKYVSGSPLKRPAWYFDTRQQGEGIVDVTTHLVDLIQWEVFPGVKLCKDDVRILSSKRWATGLTPSMFKKVTGLETYPGFLLQDVKDSILNVFCNGEINYTLKDIHAKVSVTWNFQAPEGAGDTHYSIMRGTKCNLVIEQGEKEGYQPQLYIEAIGAVNTFEGELEKAVQTLSSRFPGISVKKLGGCQKWVLNIPDSYKVGHEAHFTQVTEKYLQYLVNEEMPDWEVPNMIVKYYTTSSGLKEAMLNRAE